MIVCCELELGCCRLGHRLNVKDVWRIRDWTDMQMPSVSIYPDSRDTGRASFEGSMSMACIRPVIDGLKISITAHAAVPETRTTMIHAVYGVFVYASMIFSRSNLGSSMLVITRNQLHVFFGSSGLRWRVVCSHCVAVPAFSATNFWAYAFLASSTRCALCSIFALA